jgi:hypothetical protein
MMTMRAWQPSLLLRVTLLVAWFAWVAASSDLLQ